MVTLCTMIFVGAKVVLSAAETGLEKTSGAKRRKRRLGKRLMRNIRAFGYGEETESWLIQEGVVPTLHALNEFFWRSEHMDAPTARLRCAPRASTPWAAPHLGLRMGGPEPWPCLLSAGGARSGDAGGLHATGVFPRPERRAGEDSRRHPTAQSGHDHVQGDWPASCPLRRLIPELSICIPMTACGPTPRKCAPRCGPRRRTCVPPRGVRTMPRTASICCGRCTRR